MEYCRLFVKFRFISPSWIAVAKFRDGGKIFEGVGPLVASQRMERVENMGPINGDGQNEAVPLEQAILIVIHGVLQISSASSDTSRFF